MEINDGLYLGLDLGTSGCKLIAFDKAGKIFARANRDYQPQIPKPGIEELDADAVWEYAQECFLELALNEQSIPVKTLAISAQGEAFVLVDKDGKTLCKAPISADMRGLPYVQPLIDQFGLTELLKNAWKVLCFGEFALLKMGLEPVIDKGMAARMMLYDLEADNWSETLVNKAGLSINQLPSISDSGSTIGTLSDEMSAALKLPQNVEIILGGHDQPMGALGAGVIDNTTAIYSLGTTVASVVPLDEFDISLCEKNIPVYPNVIPNSYVAIVGNQSGGRVFSWMRDLLDIDGTVTFEMLLENIQDIASNNPILLPHFSGSGSVFNDSTSKGVLYGLSFDTTREQIVSSVLEGIIFEQAYNLKTMSENTTPLKRIRVIGGGSLSDYWMQMKADILNCEVYRMAVHDAPCLGAAILGRRAIEPQNSLPSIIEEMTLPLEHFSPRPDFHKLHAERLKIYEKIYHALKPTNKDFALFME